jgi:hypothetical protein
MSGFADGVVGAKSKNLANLRGKIPDWIRLPPAVTVPFSSFEQVRCSTNSSTSRHALCLCAVLNGTTWSSTDESLNPFPTITPCWEESVDRPSAVA